MSDATLPPGRTEQRARDEAIEEVPSGTNWLALGAAVSVLLLLLLVLQAVLRAGGPATELAVEPSAPASVPAVAPPPTPEAPSPSEVVAPPEAVEPPAPVPPAPVPSLTATAPSLAVPTAAPAPSFAPPPAPVPASGPRPPTADDAAAFLSAHPPAQGPEVNGAPRSLVADLNGDGANEVLVTSLRDSSGILEVASWDGTAYRLVFTSTVGAAQRLLELRADQLVGDARPEVLVRTGVGTDPAEGGTAPPGERLAVFGSVGERFGPSVAVGGCWDRSFVYGATGAVISDGELRASCPPDPATGAPRTDVYVFDGAAWTFTRTEGA